MPLQVTGKHIVVGKAFQTYVEDKLNAAIDKYIGQHLAAHVRLEKSRGRFRTACSVRLRTGLTLEAEGEGPEAHASADTAFEHLEKQLRRYKRRLKSHQHGANGPRRTPGIRFSGAVVDDAGEDAGEVAEVGATAAPLIVAEPVSGLQPMTVKAAAERLDGLKRGFLAFRNASTGSVDVVYRRDDGHIGWVASDGEQGNGKPTVTAKVPRKRVEA